MNASFHFLEEMVITFIALYYISIFRTGYKVDLFIRRTMRLMEILPLELLPKLGSK